jgi:hypothetical protein
MKTKTHFAFRIDIWDDTGGSIVDYVAGALLFGWLTDRFGRRLVFYLTLIIYLAGLVRTLREQKRQTQDTTEALPSMRHSRRALPQTVRH